jgi:hypothetical protein
MIVLYLLLLLLLASLHLLLHWRALWLERAYTRVCAEASALAKACSTRGGNTNKPDPYQAARQQYELALVTLRRDRVESAYAWWQAAADRIGSWRKALAAFKGKLLPYASGILDLVGAVTLSNWLRISAAHALSLLGLA